MKLLIIFVIILLFIVLYYLHTDQIENFSNYNMIANGNLQGGLGFGTNSENLNFSVVKDATNPGKTAYVLKQTKFNSAGGYHVNIPAETYKKYFLSLWKSSGDGYDGSLNNDIGIISNGKSVNIQWTIRETKRIGNVDWYNYIYMFTTGSVGSIDINIGSTGSFVSGHRVYADILLRRFISELPNFEFIKDLECLIIGNRETIATNTIPSLTDNNDLVFANNVTPGNLINLTSNSAKIGVSAKALMGVNSNFTIIIEYNPMLNEKGILFKAESLDINSSGVEVIIASGNGGISGNYLEINIGRGKYTYDLGRLLGVLKIALMYDIITNKLTLLLNNIEIPPNVSVPSSTGTEIGESMASKDTVDWDNGSGHSCASYAGKWCSGGQVRTGLEWTLGARYNHPEKNCTVCGKGSILVGNDVVKRTAPDGASNTQYVDTAQSFPSSGVVTSIQMNVGRVNQKRHRIQIYTPDTGGHRYKLKSESEDIPSPNLGKQIYTFKTPIVVAAGDYIGWSNAEQGTIEFDNGGKKVRWKNGLEGVGNVINFSTASLRTYSYAVKFVAYPPLMPPPARELVGKAIAPGTIDFTTNPAVINYQQVLTGSLKTLLIYKKFLKIQELTDIEKYLTNSELNKDYNNDIFANKKTTAELSDCPFTDNSLCSDPDCQCIDWNNPVDVPPKCKIKINNHCRNNFTDPKCQKLRKDSCDLRKKKPTCNDNSIVSQLKLDNSNLLRKIHTFKNLKTIS